LQLLHQTIDVASNSRNRRQALSCGIMDPPILVRLARIDRARVAAAHGDDHVGGADEFVAGRANVDAAVGVLLEEPGCYLATTRVVHAHEQDFGVSLPMVPCTCANARKRSRANRLTNSGT
jgi:hypothetical protein